MSALEENRETLRKEISVLLDKLSAGRAHLVFENSSDGINPFLDDIEKLHRKTAALQALLALPEEKPVVIEKVVEKIVEKIVEKPIPVPAPVVPEIPKTPEPVILPPVVKTEPAPVVIPEVKAPEIKTEIPIVKAEEKKPEIPVAKTEEKKPEGKKMPDIRSFIGFNEKIMFIRLFKNDAPAYEEAMNQVNGSASYEEAMAFVSVLHSEYNWSNANESVQTFNDTVKRRFA